MSAGSRKHPYKPRVAQRTTTSHSVARRTAMVLRSLGLAAVAFTLVAITLQHPHPNKVSPEPTATLVELLISENDCWTDLAPEPNLIPGHVVVTIDGRTRVGGPRMTGRALDQLFAGEDHGIDAIHAFCR